VTDSTHSEFSVLDAHKELFWGRLARDRYRVWHAI
jgi:hypothetical protein